MRLRTIGFVCLALCWINSPAQAADISGAWKIDAEGGISPVCSFAQVGSELSASCVGPEAAGTLTGAMDGPTVQWRWQWVTHVGRNSGSFSFTGTLGADNEITGQVERPETSLSLTFTAKRQLAQNIIAVHNEVSASAPAAFLYRGFALDVSAVSNFANIENSVEHQLDIVADSGVKPEIEGFFRAQKFAFRPGLIEERHTPGVFDPEIGIELDAVMMAPQKPIVLHELLHAFHAYILPGGIKNPDVLFHYNRAMNSHLYPANEYVLKNAKEFFAVTASLYLWGNVDREPHTRENLRARQPSYYQWLGQLFGTEK
jgi:hypothetical protein